MMRLLPVLALALATPAVAETDVFARAAGLYGSAVDPAQSCQSNPHRLGFLASPPHAIFTWTHPAVSPSGDLADHARYDILGADAGSITLRREGDPARTPDGRQPIWVLRLTQVPAGYCWGRADWPVVRCIDPAVRCDDSAPTS